MKKIKLLIEYDGTAYHGWQIQKDNTTIQGVLEEILSKITNERTRVISASRTDAGVHALCQVVAFKTQTNLSPDIIKRALNSNLPADIRIIESTEVDISFHPQRDALKKSYVYFIANQPYSSPFLYRYTWHIPYRLNISLMKDASGLLIGKKDFSSFMGSGSNVKNRVREIYNIEIERSKKAGLIGFSIYGNFIKIRIEANGFLKHMVRNIVGTLVDVGRGKISIEKMQEIISSKDRRLAGRTAPAHALFLEKIIY